MNNKLFEKFAKAKQRSSSIVGALLQTKVVLVIVGIGSLIWFLLRVLPKPSRASYPCMKATAPLASSFILYIIGITASSMLLKKARENFKKAKYALTFGLTLAGLVLGVIFTIQQAKPALANIKQTSDSPNSPMGTGKGVFPGRVAWIYNPDATNINGAGDWADDANTNQSVVSVMLSDALKTISGGTTDKESWDAIFKNYNNTHSRGDNVYKKGEKIVIKINLNGVNNGGGSDKINTSPQVCYAIINQLVNVVGVSQSDISIGDPNINFNSAYDNLQSAFPNVNYWSPGVSLSGSEMLYGSDGGFEVELPQDYIDATYMINIPVLKKHHRAGISICAKNHFGSVTPYLGSAFSVHYSLPSPDATGEAVNGDYGTYRCFVDILGHKDLGGKTVLNVVDGLWGSVNWGHPAVKWRMAPFNNDYPSSLMVSQDVIALESVCLDFLRKEFDATHPTEGEFVGNEKGPFPQFAGVDDYLHQAADPKNWAAGISYDPENDGSVLTSLGVHEHWNNATDKKYTRNLGTGSGIELYTVVGTSIRGSYMNSYNGFELKQNYPNPFKGNTIIEYKLKTKAHVKLDIFSGNGQFVTTLENRSQQAGNYEKNWNSASMHRVPGYYFCRLTVASDHEKIALTRKMLIN